MYTVHARPQVCRKLLSRACSVNSFALAPFCREPRCFLSGLLYLGFLCAMVIPTGTVWFSPQCSPFVMMNSHHKRTEEDPGGEFFFGESVALAK